MGIRDTGDGPALLLACFPGEAHDLGLVVFGIFSARRGWRVTLLGADRPIETARASIRRIEPTLTGLVAIRSSLLNAHADEVRKLTAGTRTAIAGISDTQAILDLGAGALPPTSSKQRGHSARNTFARLSWLCRGTGPPGFRQPQPEWFFRPTETLTAAAAALARRPHAASRSIPTTW